MKIFRIYKQSSTIKHHFARFLLYHQSFSFSQKAASFCSLWNYCVVPKPKNQQNHLVWNLGVRSDQENSNCSGNKSTSDSQSWNLIWKQRKLNKLHPTCRMKLFICGIFISIAPKVPDEVIHLGYFNLYCTQRAGYPCPTHECLK